MSVEPNVLDMADRLIEQLGDDLRSHLAPRSAAIHAVAHLNIKQQTIDRTAPLGTPPGRYRPPDPILDFLERL